MASPARGNASGKGGLEKEPTEIRHSGVNGIGLSLRRPAARPFIIATFFFSSRRRHTRSYGDWRSDVCSSDLLPPLRERMDDVPLLARHFLVLHCRRLDRRVDGFAPEVLTTLQRYSYPGNVRELSNIIERAVDRKSVV